MTFIISKNIAEIVEMFQKEKLDIQVLSVYSKVFSAAYFTVGCTSVSPTELFKVLSVFTGLPNCFTQLSSLNPGAWDSSLYQSGFKLAVMLSQSPSTGSNLVVSCSSPNSQVLLIVVKILPEDLIFIISLGGSIKCRV